jgi:hypothetical protein
VGFLTRLTTTFRDNAWCPRDPLTLSISFTTRWSPIVDGRYGLLDCSDPPDPFTTAGALHHAREDAGAPMPSFPEGSPAFAAPPIPTRPASAASNVEVVSDRELAALREAVPSASPSIIRVSTASLEAIRVAMPSLASSISRLGPLMAPSRNIVPPRTLNGHQTRTTPQALCCNSSGLYRLWYGPDFHLPPMGQTPRDQRSSWPLLQEAA